MNVTEIINRSEDVPVHEIEMTFTVESYLKEVKGVDVTISTTKSDPFLRLNIRSHMSKLLYAFNTAKDYFKLKK